LASVLLVIADDTSRACLKRLEQEYALRAKLDLARAARPVALSPYYGHLSLVLEDQEASRSIRGAADHWKYPSFYASQSRSRVHCGTCISEAIAAGQAM
jgi:hypothetical protein